jgi:hypothetical protein
MPDRASVEANKKKFPPGTPIAKAEGCTCSDVNNCYGKGYMNKSGTWAIKVGCPLHYWC